MFVPRRQPLVAADVEPEPRREVVEAAQGAQELAEPVPARSAAGEQQADWVIDRPGGSSIANWSTVLEGILRDHPSDTIYIFGHAGTNFPITGGRADLAVQRDYLAALLEYVRGEIKAGKPRDVIVKFAEPLKSFPDHGPLTERVLGAAFDELSA